MPALGDLEIYRKQGGGREEQKWVNSKGKISGGDLTRNEKPSAQVEPDTHPVMENVKKVLKGTVTGKGAVLHRLPAWKPAVVSWLNEPLRVADPRAVSEVPVAHVAWPTASVSGEEGGDRGSR